MITRGHFIGEIVDEFAAISAQVKMRNRLGLTDLTVYAENFMRDVLNVLLSLRLKNLNKTRSNEPGIDLGDEKARQAFQVTSNPSGDKVNKTLGKVTDEQLSRFSRIVVLVVGTKQGSYTLEPTLAKRCSFSEGDVWDMDDLARKTMDLDIAKLQKLHQLVRTNTARLKMELEIPDQGGKYAIHAYDQWETAAAPRLGDGKAFAAFQHALHRADYSAKDFADLDDALQELAQRLSSLPRMTREFLAMLCEFATIGDSNRFFRVSAHILYSKVERQYMGDDLEGELDILRHDGFIEISADNVDVEGTPQIGIRLSRANEALAVDILRFIRERKLGMRTVIGEVDLSAF